MVKNDWNLPGSGVAIYHKVFIPAMIGEWAPRTLALVNPRPGERGLDVACGTGVLTRAMAHAVGPKGQVIGADLSADMLNLAREFSQAQHPGIEWRECDAQKLPFEDASFDFACCQLGMMFFPDKLAALKEMERVLKPGGRLGVMVWGRMDQCPGQTAMAKTWEKLFGAEQAAGFHRQHSMSNPDGLRSLLVKTGFQDVHVQPILGTMRFQTVEHLVRAYGAMGRFPADEAQQKAAIDEVTQELQAYMRPDGLVYPIEAVLSRAVK